MTDHDVIIDAQVDIPNAVSEGSILSLVNHILTAEGVDEAWELGIQFVDDPTMQAAHIEFMDIDEPTDIMTFPYSDEDDVWGDAQAGGDLMISVDRARSHALDAGWDEVDELYFLIAHGVLHLLGWDDHNDLDRANMLARQRELLETWTYRP